MSSIPGYVRRDDIHFTAVEGRELLQLQAKQIVRRVMNVALEEYDREFKAALERGELLEVINGGAEIERYLRLAVQKELGSGASPQETA